MQLQSNPRPLKNMQILGNSHSFKNIKFFSLTPVLAGDNDDLMSRIDQLMNKNKSLFEKSKPELLSKNRESMDESLKKSYIAIAEHLKHLSASLTDQDKKKWDDLANENYKLLNLYVKKISDLDVKDPSSEEKANKLYHLAKKSKNICCDKLESLGFEAVKADTEYKEANWIEKQFFNAARTKTLKEREKVLKADEDLYLKEQEYFKSKSSESKDNSSLIDDFANPNLEQASFMDPED